MALAPSAITGGKRVTYKKRCLFPQNPARLGFEMGDRQAATWMSPKAGAQKRPCHFSISLFALET